MLDRMLARNEFAGSRCIHRGEGTTDIAGIANIDAGLLISPATALSPKTGNATSLARISSTFMGPTLPAQFAGYRQRNRKQKLSLPNCVAL
jgi:hypothetical protein